MMSRIKTLFALLVAGTVSLNGAGIAHALVQDAWVDPNGVDAGNFTCLSSSPCRTVDWALSQLFADRGTVHFKSSGSYAPFTVTKDATIFAAQGLDVSITAPSGGSGITVNVANPDDTVHLNGIDVEGTGTGALAANCINVISAKTVNVGLGMRLRNCTRGINMGASGAQLNIGDGTEIDGGYIAGGVGVYAASGNTTITNSRISGSMPGGALVLTQGTAKLAIHGGQLVGSPTGVTTAVVGLLAGSTRAAVVEGTTITHMAWGVFTNTGGARVCVWNAKLTYNNLAIFPQSGNICTNGVNMFEGNTADGTFSVCNCGTM
jgi:hypothetical protein